MDIFLLHFGTKLVNIMLLVISVDDTIFLFFCAFFLPECIETSTVGPEISLGLSCGTQPVVHRRVFNHLQCCFHQHYQVYCPFSKVAMKAGDDKNKK